MTSTLTLVDKRVSPSVQNDVVTKPRSVQSLDSTGGHGDFLFSSFNPT